ncbi:hypothetical protein [Pyruvatibacter sp.]
MIMFIAVSATSLVTAGSLSLLGAPDWGIALGVLLTAIVVSSQVIERDH